MCFLYIILNFGVYLFWTNTVSWAAVPVINNLPNSTTIHEDTSSEILLYTIDVTDADGDSITCSFGSGTNPVTGTSRFSVKFISGTSAWGIFTVASANYDFNSQPDYALEIDCVANGETATSTYTVYLSENQAPVIQNLPASVNLSTLNGAVGDNVFTMIGTDAENDQITYTISCNPVSPACPFEIFDSGALQLNGDISAPAVTGYDVTVDISDSNGSGTSLILTVLFTDINTQPQIQNLGTTLNVIENLALGDTLTTTICTDSDVTDTLIYSLTCTPSSGSTYFLIDSSTGVITVSSSSLINYEYLLAAGSTSFSCTVTCNDGRASDTATVDFDVIDINEAPVLSQSAYSISADEGPAGTVIQITSYSVTEEDAGDSLTFSLDCGASSGYFSINTSTGIISYSTDYDVDDVTRPSSVTCDVTVTDSGGLNDTATMAIAINNINDNAPTFSQPSYVWFISESDPVGTTVGTAVATDGDIGTFGNITYSLDQSGLTAEYFQINQAGVVTLNIQHSTGITPSFYVLATDGGGNETRVVAQVVIAATTTPTTTTTTDRFKTFFDDGRNIAWFTACIVLLAVTAILIGWMCFAFTGGNSGYGYAKYNFRCCTFWDEEPRQLRNWGEGHRDHFRVHKRPTERKRTRRPHNFQFWSENYPQLD